MQRFLFGLGEVVVYHRAVVPGCETKLVLGAAYALVDNLGAVGSAFFEAAAQFFDRGGLDEYAQRARAVYLLDVAAADDVDVENDVRSLGKLFFDLRLERAVKAVVVHFGVFEELAGGYLVAELVGREKEVFNAVFLLAAGRARSGANGKRQIEPVAEKRVYDG